MSIAVHSLVILYVAFTAKHFLADYLLQSNWMLWGREQVHGWLAPLAAHAGCHAALTLVLALVFAPALWWLALVDFVVHATIDRGKTLAVRALRVANTDRSWWALFGGDQALHQLTHFAYVIVMLTR